MTLKLHSDPIESSDLYNRSCSRGCSLCFVKWYSPRGTVHCVFFFSLTTEHTTEMCGHYHQCPPSAQSHFSDQDPHSERTSLLITKKQTHTHTPAYSLPHLRRMCMRVSLRKRSYVHVHEVTEIRFSKPRARTLDCGTANAADGICEPLLHQSARACVSVCACVGGGDRRRRRSNMSLSRTRCGRCRSRDRDGAQTRPLVLFDSREKRCDFR